MATLKVYCILLTENLLLCVEVKAEVWSRCYGIFSGYNRKPDGALTLLLDRRWVVPSNLHSWLKDDFLAASLEKMLLFRHPGGSLDEKGVAQRCKQL